MVVFRRRGSPLWALLAVAVAAPAAQVAKDASDAEAWRRIDASCKDRIELKCCAAYRGFVAQYPNSQLAPLQTRKLMYCARLAAQAEGPSWTAAQDGQSCQGYRDYLALFPDGSHATDAKSLIGECEQREAKRAPAPAATPSSALVSAPTPVAKPSSAQVAAPTSKPVGAPTKKSIRVPCGTYYWDAKQLSTYYKNRTWEGTTPNGKWQEFHAPDGTLYGAAWRDGVRRPDYLGRWRLDGDSYCVCTGACTRFTCRKVRQLGTCPNRGETWTWNTATDSKWRQLDGVHKGDVYGLARRPGKPEKGAKPQAKAEK